MSLVCVLIITTFTSTVSLHELHIDMLTTPNKFFFGSNAEGSHLDASVAFLLTKQPTPFTKT